MTHCNAVHNDVKIQNQLGALTGSSEALRVQHLTRCRDFYLIIFGSAQMCLLTAEFSRCLSKRMKPSGIKNLAAKM